MNDDINKFPGIGTTANGPLSQQAQYYDASNSQMNTLADFSNYNYDNRLEVENLKKSMQTLKLQTLKMTEKIDEDQYKSILGMLASTDERDLEMARLSIRTLWDEHL